MRGSLFGNTIDQMLLEGEPLQDIANNRLVRAALLARHLYDCPRLDLPAHARAQAHSPAGLARLTGPRFPHLTSPVSTKLQQFLQCHPLA
ncbi:hypothetical protein LGN17_35615 [Burkholderia sp. AU30280]|uniref:hypothetical protein n=1 Tax=Burkholderia sp. AU30280 TaxID=2879628 RepID=UPI001CF381B0|nr:hypothetical protein [Burkholderia sp. AU30280]MCA8277815.1 hypothetical protein [Burkholderia sp. AU30280]